MEKQITFGVDVDGVLRNLFGKMVDVYNRETNSNRPYGNIFDYKVSKLFPDIQDGTDWFFSKHGHEIFSTAEVIDGAADAVKALREIGSVIIITFQRHTENIIDTIKWLDEHGIAYDDICFIRDKSHITGIDYFIDDYQENFIGCNAKHGILINADYNANADDEQILQSSKCETLQRFDGIKEFADSLQPICE